MEEKQRCRMTREEAIQQIKWYFECDDGIVADNTIKEAIDMAIEALEEQEISNELQEYAYECGYKHFFHECQNCELRRITNKAQDWVPCSEGLPDTDVPVLVSDGVYVWEDELQEDYEDGKTVYWWDSQCSFDFNDTAWMPKPKPYKREGSNEV